MIKFLGILILALSANMFFVLVFDPQGMSAEGYILGWGMTLAAIFAGPATWRMAGGHAPVEGWGVAFLAISLCVTAISVYLFVDVAMLARTAETEASIVLGVFAAMLAGLGLLMAHLAQKLMADSINEPATSNT